MGCKGRFSSLVSLAFLVILGLLVLAFFCKECPTPMPFLYFSLLSEEKKKKICKVACILLEFCLLKTCTTETCASVYLSLLISQNFIKTKKTMQFYRSIHCILHIEVVRTIETEFKFAPYKGLSLIRKRIVIAPRKRKKKPSNQGC